MPNTKFRALAGASAMALAMGVALSAHAQTVSPPVQPANADIQIYGAGSTLVQPYIRQAEDCFGTPAPTWDKSVPPVATNEPAFNFTGTPAQNCATSHPDVHVTLQYQGVGSGGGILGVFDHNAHDFNSGGNFTSGGVAAFFARADYGASDLPLGAADVDVYNNGGTLIPTPAKTTDIQGSNNPGGSIPNPLAHYGPLVQYPLLVAPVTVAYSQIYKEVFNSDTGKTTSYKFHLPSATVVVGGVSTFVPKLKLSGALYCEIFNGIVTDWNDSRIGTLNAYTAPAGGITVGGVFHAAGSTVTTLEDPHDPTPAASFSVPIELVGRSDSSGTTGIFTRHLDAECPHVLPSGENNAIVTGPTLPAGRIGGGGNPSGPGSGFFTVENGSGAVASYMAFVAPTAGAPTSVSGKIGYLGPDFVRPYSATATGLVPAALQNHAGPGSYILPSPGAALKAFGSSLPPESGSGGGYVPASGSQPRRSQPDAWVQAFSPTAPIATAADTVFGAYAITGTTNVLAYTCYTDAHANSVNNIGFQVNQFLKWYELSGTVISTNGSSPGILALRGFGVVPPAWRTAIKETFLVPTKTSSGGHPPTNALKLWISSKSDVGGFTHNPACNGKTGAG
jgi:ABC-type phosphate transport system substrate-binding protein